MKSEDDYLRGSYALIVTELVPEILRRPALSDETFTKSLGLVADGLVNFAPANVSFHRSKLVKAVRDASAAEGLEAPVVDEAGQIWKVKISLNEASPTVIIAAGGKEICVPHLAALSERRQDRLGVLASEAKRAGLPDSAKEQWWRILEERALQDHEVITFSDDINDTPVSVTMAIRNDMRADTASFDVLVPRSKRYFERLIGEWAGQKNIQSYATEVLPDFIASLLRRDETAGLRLALLSCSHSFVVRVIAGTQCNAAAFEKTVRWAANQADPMSRCGLLELGFLRTQLSEECKTTLSELAGTLVVPAGGTDQLFETFSRLFIFVYGQLSQTKVLAGAPTFWRRMAAFAQAALIHRCMLENRGDFSKFTERVRDVRSRTYSRQVYVDLREGPLWHGHFALLPQIRNEFVGRVIHAARALPDQTVATSLRDVVLGEGPLSLASSVHEALTSMAGPLEDNTTMIMKLDENGRAIIRNQLTQPKLTVNSFAGVVNCALLAELPTEFADLAAEALHRTQYRFEVESQEMFVVVLTGLATCASVTRSTSLADAVMTLIRYYRRFAPGQLDLNDALRIGSIACAARADLSEWCATMGGLLADFAFHTLTPEEAAGLEDHIAGLCDLVPELWASSGPALAAAQAVAA